MDATYTARFLDKVWESTLAQEAFGANQSALAAVYSAVIRGDFETVANFLAEDAELEIRGAGAMDGHWQGRPQIVEATRANFAMVAGQKPEIRSIIFHGDSVAVLLDESGMWKKDERYYRVRAVQWFTFADGKIKRIDELVTSL